MTLLSHRSTSVLDDTPTHYNAETTGKIWLLLAGGRKIAKEVVFKARVERVTVNDFIIQTN